MLILSHGANFISDEEFIFLYEEFKPTNLSFQHSLYGDFDLDNTDGYECVAEFRVKKKDLETLAEALQIPDTTPSQVSPQQKLVPFLPTP